MPQPQAGAPPQATRRATIAHLLARWLPIALWMAGVFWVSSIPSHRLPHMRFTLADKVAHAGAYAAGGFLLARAIPRALPAALAGAAYGASDEWHQSLVRGRESDIGDWIADCAGAALGVALYRAFTRKRGSASRSTKHP